VAPDGSTLLVGAVARDLLFIPMGYEQDMQPRMSISPWRFPTRMSSKGCVNGCWPQFFLARPESRAQAATSAADGSGLVPFGGVELPNGTIAWPPEGDTVMRVLGFQVALASSISVETLVFRNGAIIAQAVFEIGESGISLPLQEHDDWGRDDLILRSVSGSNDKFDWNQYSFSE
jgi:hypothetical protein